MKLFAKQRLLNRVMLVDIAEITPSPYQPRRRFDPKALRELADSIAQNGLLQPITIRPKEDGYELIAGERRLMACKMLSMDKIAAIIEQVDDEKSAVFALVENLQRKDLNYFEEAQGIQQLMLFCRLTQQQVADKLGKGQSTIANKLRLLNFSEDMRTKMLDAGLTERHARSLLRLPDEEMVVSALERIVNERMNVGETEKYVDALLEAEQEEPEQENPPEKPTRLFIVKDLRVFMNTISKAVSTMKLAGIDIDTEQSEDDEFINYKLRIPKKSAYTTPVKQHPAV